MSYYMICPNCGKGTIGRYATDNSLCGECSDNSSTTDEKMVEKLEPIGYYNEAHGFLHEEFDKDCYCQGGCSMEAVYTESQVKKLTDEKTVEKLQEQLSTAKKALTEIVNANDNLFLNVDGRGDLDTALDNARDALAAIGGDDDENRL